MNHLAKLLRLMGRCCRWNRYEYVRLRDVWNTATAIAAGEGTCPKRWPLFFLFLCDMNGKELWNLGCCFRVPLKIVRVLKSKMGAVCSKDVERGVAYKIQCLRK